jgi:hypothetical protein
MFDAVRGNFFVIAQAVGAPDETLGRYRYGRQHNVASDGIRLAVFH